MTQGLGHVELTEQWEFGAVQGGLFCLFQSLVSLSFLSLKRRTLGNPRKLFKMCQFLEVGVGGKMSPGHWRTGSTGLPCCLLGRCTPKT